jgi:hypothetical protein
VKDATGSLLSHLMEMNNTPELRMPRLELLDLMGVISSPREICVETLFTMKEIDTAVIG